MRGIGSVRGIDDYGNEPLASAYEVSGLDAPGAVMKRAHIHRSRMVSFSRPIVVRVPFSKVPEVLW